MNIVKFTESDSFIESQSWIYSTFAGVSMAFFLSLFSAGELAYTSAYLKVSIFLYAASLTINGLLSFLIFVYKNDKATLRAMNHSKKFSFVPTVAVITFIIATLSLVSFFSLPAATLMFFVGGAVFNSISDVFIDQANNKSQDSDI